MFFLLYKHTDDGVFDHFPKISDHFPKISEDFPKLFRRPDERSRAFPEISVRFSEQIMSPDKYPSIFSRQMATIVYMFSLVSAEYAIGMVRGLMALKHYGNMAIWQYGNMV